MRTNPLAGFWKPSAPDPRIVVELTRQPPRATSA
jgi:hypothetical protein